MERNDGESTLRAQVKTDHSGTATQNVDSKIVRPDRIRRLSARTSGSALNRSAQTQQGVTQLHASPSPQSSDANVRQRSSPYHHHTAVT
jgi:hypothetical protein